MIEELTYEQKRELLKTVGKTYSSVEEMVKEREAEDLCIICNHPRAWHVPLACFAGLDALDSGAIIPCSCKGFEGVESFLPFEEPDAPYLTEEQWLAQYANPQCRCIRCDREIEQCWPKEEGDNLPEGCSPWSSLNNAMDFQGTGNYGTTYFDPSPLDKRRCIEIAVCDSCLEATKYKQRVSLKTKAMLEANMANQEAAFRMLAESGGLEKEIAQLKQEIADEAEVPTEAPGS